MTLYPYLPDFDSKLRKSMLGQPGFFNEAASHCLCKFYQFSELFFFKNLMWNIFHLDIVIVLKISSLFVTRFTVGPLIFDIWKCPALTFVRYYEFCIFQTSIVFTLFVLYHLGAKMHQIYHLCTKGDTSAS